MTANEARERLDALLLEVHLAGMMTSSADREKFRRAWLEIFALLRDGSVDLTLPPLAEKLQPLPTKLDVSPATLPEAREQLEGLRRRLDRLRLKPRFERSAVDDDELARLPDDIAQLAREIQTAERIPV